MTTLLLSNSVVFLWLLTLLINVCVDANSVDPVQTASADLGQSTLFPQEASKTFQKTPKHTSYFMIAALRVNLN